MRTLERIAEEDKSDWTEKTRYYCESAHPTEQNKEKMWGEFFDKDNDWGYSNFNMAFAGFNQVSHRSLTQRFDDQFFARIMEIFKKKGRFVAESYYGWLAPTSPPSYYNIKRFENLLTRVQNETPENSQLINLIKDSIEEMRIHQKAQALSQKYLSQQANKAI